jgi:hypothetical protein
MYEHGHIWFGQDQFRKFYYSMNYLDRAVDIPSRVEEMSGHL